MENTPVLDAPGAGLPPFELFVARWLFRLRCWQGSREAFDRSFQSQRRKIAAMIDGLDPADGARPVLIERCRGLEDSSRNWSVWMTLEHLNIVNRRIARVIPALGKGIVPPGEASTKDVKPSPVGPEVRAAYEAACDELLAAVASVPETRTAARYVHPWFGPLDAYGWHALSAGHMNIHRVQIERILAGLSRPRVST